MVINIYRNPFLLGLWGPGYLLIGTACVLNDYLMFAMYIFATLGVLAAYVTEFPILSGLYPNELVHKVAVSSLLGILFGLVLWAISMVLAGPTESADSSPVSPAGAFFATWVAMGTPSYLMTVFLVSRLNKRDLEEEDRIRQENKKQSKGGGPPIMDRDGF